MSKEQYEEICRDWSKQCRVLGCTLPIDIVLYTSDDKKFGSHKGNLAVFNEGFPPLEIVSPEPDGKPSHVKLDDRSESLHLLLQFSHNAEQPDLRSKSTRAIMAFSTVAEKYGNRLAIQACRKAMEDLGKCSPSNALATVCYKAQNGNLAGIDEFARHSMVLSLKDATQYREVWQRDHKTYITTVKDQVNAVDRHSLVRRIQAELLAEAVPTMACVRSALDRALIVDWAVSSATRARLTEAQGALERIIEGFPVWKQFSA
ncbi:hypothetical protein VNI00_009398 [Paramarasmius palmivorus]|uniref:Uncharacterized protein n=1 Tax=Paramarasmius palmivorus TaxID=297713 RepID=A0AAW0CSP6_9AGAR